MSRLLERVPAPVVVWVTWLCRLAVGLTFTLSGFVKAVDPWGTVYKVGDYLAAFGWDVPHYLVLLFTVFLIGVEFLIGVFALFGMFRRATPVGVILFMLFMLPLTLWVAVADPVEDCGCFGDAFVISNWATFWKNVGLTLCGVWLLPFNRRVHWLVTPALQWIGAAGSVVTIVLIMWWGYNIQPPLDFRPYAVGERLVPVETEDAPAGESLLFVYAKDGREEAFTVDNLPDEEEGWEFVRRERKGAPEHKSAGLVVYDKEGEEEVTGEAILSEGKQYLLLMPEQKRFKPQYWAYKINTIEEGASREGIEMAALMAASPEEVERYEDLAMPDYPIYTAEDTQIKEIARGNPALVYLEDGVVRSKISLKGLSIFDSEKTQKGSGLLYRQFLYGVCLVWGFLFIFLTFSSFMPKIPWLRKNNRQKLCEEDKKH